MSIASVPVFTLQTRDGRRLTLQSAEGHVAHIFAIDRNIVRMMVLPFGRLRHQRTWRSRRAWKMCRLRDATVST